jgi:hypothetical protein
MIKWGSDASGIAKEAPVAMLGSGPLGGFIAAALMGTRVDRPNVIPWLHDLPLSRFRAGTGATISTYGYFE